MEPVTSALSALGLKLSVVVASAVGGFLSLNFFDGLTTRQKWLTAFSGCALGSYLSGLVLWVVQIPSTHNIEVGMGVVVSLFGMSVAAAIIKAFRSLDVKGIVDSWLRRKP